MNEKRSIKRVAAVPCAIFFVHLFKMLLLAAATQLGVDFYKGRLSFSYKTVIFWCCAIALSALIAVFYTTVRKKNEACANIFGALIVADPAFILITRMPQCLILYVAVFLFLCNHIKEKPLVKTEIVLFFLSFVCSLLFPYAIFSCVMLMLCVYIVSCKPADRCKAMLVATSAAALAAAGGLLNRYMPFADFARQLNTLFVTDNTFRILLISSIPYALIALCFVYKYIKEPVQRVGKKKNRQESSGYILPLALLLVCGVGVACSVISEPIYVCMALCMLNLSLVLLPIVAVCKDSHAEKTMDAIADYVNKHIAVVLIVMAVVVYAAIRIILHFCFIDNTIANLITSN